MNKITNFQLLFANHYHSLNLFYVCHKIKLMENRKNLGMLGEDLTCSYLKKKGYGVIKRNERNRFGEIDIIAREKSGTLVFVEVKTMREGELKPEDQMKKRKIENFRKSAEFFAGQNEELIDEKRGWRLDLVAIIIEEEKNSIVHYENI